VYLLVFDNDRLLFIRPDKIINGSGEISLNDMLKTNNRNFQIPFKEISKIELNNERIGMFSVRSGKLTIKSSKHRRSFDILAFESYEECKKIIKQFLEDKLVIK